MTLTRRNFTIQMTTLSTALVTGSTMSCSERPVQESEKELPHHWVWIRPNLEWSEDQWKKSFDEIRKMGIQGFLPQVYSSNETLFDHPLLPVKEKWLEKIIPWAHAADLQVHAWMWTMPLNNKELIEKHPDWFSVNRNGQPTHTHPAYVDYYKFLCPCHPEVQEFVAGNVEALAKIEDLDGIHLDYVRQPDVILAEALQPNYNIVQDKEYPEYDYPYSENCRNLFKEQTGIDPIELGEDAPYNEEWRQFRYDAVSNVVNNYCVPFARKYDKKITAAVFPNWESVRQQWHKWDLDAFLPMLYHGFYNKEVDWVGEEVKKALVRLQNSKPVYSGLFLEHCPGNLLEEAIQISENAGAAGVSIFAYNELDAEQKSILTKVLNS